MIKSVVKKGFNGKCKLWQTKHLRDAYKNGLLRAKLPQEIVDVMFGHKRDGAKADYAVAEVTITESYKEAFKFLTINGYGSQLHKVEELEQKFDLQNKTLTEIITELRVENKQLKERLANLETSQNGAEKALMYLGKEIAGDKGIENIVKIVRSPKGTSK